MKTIFKIHPFFYLFTFLCILTGYFKIYLMITFITLFHELGHIMSALFFKWKIKKIVILPFGCITIFNEHINRRIIEELIITIMGPLFQSLLFFTDNKLFFNINLIILIFNLIPIVPLDGSKILNLLLNKIMSFNDSHLSTIYLSILSILVLIIKTNFNLVLIFILSFLLFKTIKEFLEHKYIFNKFLFERYLYKFNFKKSKIIDNPKKMKRDYKHIFKHKNKYILEHDFLSNQFDNT